MPVYEYLCPGCGLRFELLRKMAERFDSAPCPTCRVLNGYPVLSIPARQRFDLASESLSVPYTVEQGEVDVVEGDVAPDVTIRNCTFEDCHGGVRVGRNRTVAMIDTSMRRVAYPVINEGGIVRVTRPNFRAS